MIAMNICARFFFSAGLRLLSGGNHCIFMGHGWMEVLGIWMDGGSGEVRKEGRVPFKTSCVYRESLIQEFLDVWSCVWDINS